MLLRKMLVAVAVTCGIYSLSSKAEFRTSPWDGLYNTGGYNLLTFGNDLYQLSNYFDNYYWTNNLSPYTSWGTSCGLLTSQCSSPYDTLGLYGFGQNWLNLNINIDINILLTSLYGYGNNFCGYCTPPMYQYCGFSPGCYPYDIYPFYGMYNNFLTPPYYGNYKNGSSYSNYGWFDWTSAYPSVNIGINYPINTPVWGSCDNVLIPCPTTTFPYSQQQYLPTYNYVPTNPVRHKIPRGAITH